jgi:hypothetical protein
VRSMVAPRGLRRRVGLGPMLAGAGLIMGGGLILSVESSNR